MSVDGDVRGTRAWTPPGLSLSESVTTDLKLYTVR